MPYYLSTRVEYPFHLKHTKSSPERQEHHGYKQKHSRHRVHPENSMRNQSHSQWRLFRLLYKQLDTRHARPQGRTENATACITKRKAIRLISTSKEQEQKKKSERYLTRNSHCASYAFNLFPYTLCFVVYLFFCSVHIPVKRYHMRKS